MQRIYIKTATDMKLTEQVLDKARLDYDWDNGDRLMIADENLKEVTDILLENGIDFNEI